MRNLRLNRATLFRVEKLRINIGCDKFAHFTVQHLNCEYIKAVEHMNLTGVRSETLKLSAQRGIFKHKWRESARLLKSMVGGGLIIRTFTHVTKVLSNEGFKHCQRHNGPEG